MPRVSYKQVSQLPNYTCVGGWGILIKGGEGEFEDLFPENLKLSLGRGVSYPLLIRQPPPPPLQLATPEYDTVICVPFIDHLPQQSDTGHRCVEYNTVTGEVKKSIWCR